MELLFLGTGAADYDWSRYGDDATLGSTAALLGKHILLDCGPTVGRAMQRYGVPGDAVTAIVNTHSHGDHFAPEVIRAVAGSRKIDFYGTPQACERVRDFCRPHPLRMGDAFAVGDCHFLTLPANHAVEDLHEETFNFLISRDGKTLLYALDTAWMTTRARRLLGKTRLDGIVWDGTMSEPGDWRIFEHSDPEMFRSVRKVLTDAGNIHADTQIWLSHRARTLWPADAAAQEAIAAGENVLLAHDGERVLIGGAAH